LNNITALLSAYAYVALVLALGERIRTWRGYPVEFTRKVIHIGVGMWAVFTPLVFADAAWAVVPPLSFVVVNYLSLRLKIFKAMERDDGGLGTVYFPITFSLLVYLFWDMPAVFVGGIMVMTWGDALAAVVGRAWGRRKYVLLGATRSLEGSLTMFLVSFLAVAVTLLGFGVEGILVPALVTALAGTAVEAVSVGGTDNLTVPVVSALILWWLVG